MDCKQFREVMDLYMDGELAPGAAAAASMHVAECPPCRLAVSHLTELQSAVRAEVTRVPLPEGFHQRLTGALAHPALQKAPPQKAPKTSLRRLPWPAWLGLAAIPVLLLFLTAVPGGGRSMAANLLERVAFHLDRPRTEQLTGKLVCRDCTLETIAGMRPACERHGHHGALMTSDGHIWNIVEDDASERLIHDPSLLGKQFRLSGVTYRQADAIQVVQYVQLI